jgi:hypothetical protein
MLGGATDTTDGNGSSEEPHAHSTRLSTDIHRFTAAIIT